MSSKEKTKTNDTEVIKQTNKSLELIKNGRFEEALESFSLILKNNYSNSAAESGIKCCKYWIPRNNKFRKLNDNYEKGKLIFNEWKKFEKFSKSLKNIHSKVISNVMFYIFNSALEAFKKEIRENRILDFETYYIIALSYKKIGDFKNAIKYFEETLNIENDNSNIIAQLADCYALIDEEKKAKLLFREAFFIDPSSIDLELLDSNIITYITAKILELNYSKKEVQYWIPIFGRVLNILNVFRELIPVEISKIKREISYIENNYKNQIDKDNCIKTKLINSYLWLIDYLKINNQDKNEIDEIENKLRSISETIYQLLKNDNKILQELK